MIAVYSDSQIIDLEWLPKLQFPDQYQVYHSFNDYAASLHSTKIAFTCHRLHCDYDANCAAYQGFEDKINKLSEISCLVFSFESEIHNYHWTIWQQCHHDNVYWMLPGYVNDNADIDSHILHWSDWIKCTVLLYRALPQQLAQIQPYEIKPKYFDALLGVPKPHRDFVHRAVNQHGLQDKFVMTYGGAWKENEFYAKDYFLYEPGTELPQQIIGTADWAIYHGQQAHLSQIIPIDVFNQTAYSIVAETDFDNTLSMFTEKIAKPMIARRLFVVFSGYRYLANLRRQGYRTFNGVIDESYDEIQDDNARLQAAFEQVRWLCEQDQHEIYQRIKPTVEHNHQLIMTRDYTQEPADLINQQIKSWL
jgi:hypothetical protein